MILNSYRYLYYKLFCWSKFVKNFGDVRDHQFYVSVMMSLLVVVYLLIAITLCQMFFPNLGGVVDRITDNLFLFILIPGFIVFAINYRYMGKIGFHDATYEQFSSESDKRRIIGNILVGSFVCGSFVLLFSLWFLFAAGH